MSGRRRLDAELVRRGLAESRSQASQLIGDGKVTVGGAPAMNATRQVHAGEPINVTGPPPKYVGRGGFKLEGALDRFAVEVTGKRAIDVGASTGGFTDCLLQRGAQSVVALDVGHGQLHEKMRAHPQVVVLERTNVRDVSPESLGLEPFDLVVVDVSFISLRTIAPAITGLAAPSADIIALIKPQFEAGRQQVSKGQGVIRDRGVWEIVVDQVFAAMTDLKAATMGLMVSPVLGAEGNVEFLGHFVAGSAEGAPHPAPDLSATFDEAAAMSEGGR